MKIYKEQFKCMNTFTHDNKFRTSDQPLPDQDKIFKFKKVKNAGKPEPLKEKEIFQFDNSKLKKKKPIHKMRDGRIMSGKTHTKNSKKLNKKDVLDPNETIGNHNKKIKLKSY